MGQTGMEDNLYTADQFIEIYGSMIAHALKKLDQLEPVEKTGKWIPVSDHLPDTEHNLEGFLTTVRCYDTYDVFISVYYDGKFGHWNGEKLIPNEDVIAWMECPKPYKGGE